MFNTQQNRVVSSISNFAKKKYDKMVKNCSDLRQSYSLLDEKMILKRFSLTERIFCGYRRNFAAELENSEYAKLSKILKSLLKCFVGSETFGSDKRRSFCLPY